VEIQLAVSSDLKSSLELPDEADLVVPLSYRYGDVGFDIETTNLKGNFGLVLAAVVKPLGQAPIILRLDDPKYKSRKPWEDKPLLEDLGDVLEDCARVFGWYSSRFDIPFLRTRRVLSGVKGTVSFRHCDMIFPCRSHFKFHNNRLETLLQMFSPVKKTSIVPEDWRRAAFMDKRSMNRVVEHCVADVCGMEDVYLHLLPFLQTWSKQTI
jgi:uncharacterized protein YprB with RNaseH-like and TPR domain